MGKRNQERRRAKQKQRRQQARSREQGQSAPSGSAFGFGGVFGGGTFGDAQDGPFGFVPPPRKPSLADELEHTVHDVIEAPEEHAEREIVVAASWLASSERRRPPLSRAVLAMTDRLFGALWRTGWQPADVVRAVRKELKARHGRLAVDMIAAEARRYAAAGLEYRWAAQLNELEAHPWWGSDEEWLPALAAREKLNHLALASCLFELLRLLSWLPALEVLCPPPNTSATATAARPASPEAARMLGRIRALLTKAESTEFPEEAEALTAKAQQLMAEHSISEALLAARGGRRDAPAGIRVGVENPYEQPKAVLLEVVAAANRCRSVWSKNLGFATVIGFEADLDAVELLYTSLLVQVTAALQAEGGRSHAGGGSRTRSFRSSFLTSYATRIGERLTEATAHATDEAVAAQGTSTVGRTGGATGEKTLLPVLAARHQAVEEETERIFPQLSYSRSSGVSDWEGWTSGRAAADRATLGTESGELT
ncbi:DUF2786 domain-containing protein [Streptomyces sp. A3M-1-3]|uniref:DUF2786 domain-containing protein n=1 Tax=Streptomyces sp. A3M-1-3 TaxID=2962044 RepID=UPI0020B898D2|nr:DUF2786 domain-containing protein [Streptomyces sp. A3M-1-3]MCP3821447.1 DUF2786 domain-containing protein [Streptomyces sp. A3M-1-3]